jgi:hypothetical protein
MRTSAKPRGAVAADKSALLSSTAELSRPQQDRTVSGERAPSSPQYPDDPAVVARQRGVFVADEAESRSPAAKPGRPHQPRGPPPPTGAYSIAEFCHAHAISESFFHKLKSQGRGPAVMRVGTRTLISVEAAAAWRATREAADKTNEQAPHPAP